MYDGKKNTSYEIFYNALKSVCENKLPGEEKISIGSLEKSS